MQLPTRSNWVSNVLSNDTPRVQVTGLYEDLKAGHRIKALIDCVHAGMELPVRFKLDLWRFDWLRECALRDIALNAAGDSALVIVSVSRARTLPAQMDKWVRAWTQDKGGHLSAMIALLPKGQEGLSPCHPLYEQLERAAEEKGADFFHEFFEPESAKHHPGKEEIFHELFPTRLPLGETSDFGKAPPISLDAGGRTAVLS